MNDDILTAILADDSLWQELQEWFLWTRRERELMQGLCAGESIKQISLRWRRSAKTAEIYKHRALEKVFADSVLEAVRIVCGAAVEIAVRRGSISKALPCASCTLRRWAEQSPLMKKSP